MFTIPNAVTLLNLFCGCAAVFNAFAGSFTLAFAFIAAGAVFDFLDGMTARLLHSYSEIGKQLDSLADMVTFGVAPSAMLFSLYTAGAGAGSPWAWSVFALAAFSALRLARFNIDDSQSSEFRGLPTPACALFVASSCWLWSIKLVFIPQWVVLAVTALLCALLVCPIRMFSLKFHGWGLRDNLLRYLFLLASAIAIVMVGVAALSLIIPLYIVVSTVRHFSCPKRTQLAD